MKIITLSDGCFTELQTALNTSNQPPAPTPPAPTPNPPPTPIPTNVDWKILARESATRQGYDPIVLFDWDWANGGVTFDTNARGKVGARGIFIASFVATGKEDKDNLAYFDAIGYPAPTQSNILTATLSTTPCDFTVTEPAKSESYAPTVTFGVGTVPIRWWDKMPTAVALTPGVRYFINVSGRDSYEPAKFGGPEFRIAMRVPNGH